MRQNYCRNKSKSRYGKEIELYSAIITIFGFQCSKIETYSSLCIKVSVHVTVRQLLEFNTSFLQFHFSSLCDVATTYSDSLSHYETEGNQQR